MARRFLQGLAAVLILPALAQSTETRRYPTPNPVVELKTSQGPIVFELLPAKAPRTVEKFLSQVREGRYDGVPFDRIERGFVIEAGPRREPGEEGPGLAIEADNGLKNISGAVGLAEDHFYVNLSDNPHLDTFCGDPLRCGLTIFGRVLSGMDTARNIGASGTTPARIDAASVVQEEDPGAVLRAQEKTLEVLSDVYTIDKKYRSMKGPQSSMPVKFEAGPRELLWITGYSADVVTETGDGDGLIEYMCHSNFDIDASAHARLWQGRYAVNPRLFTISQGQTDIRFPDGFGIPVTSDESFSLTTQVLNLNYDSCDLKVRHRTRIRYVRDADLTIAMKPLYQTAVYGLKLLQGADGRYGIDPAEPHHGASCLPGANADAHTYTDAFDRKFTGHWVVKPGREVNRTPVDAMLQLPEDTTAHYIAVHLHPFAESLELYDATEKKTVWKSNAVNPAGRIGLERVETYSSEEGLPLHRDHHYELVSVYNNTSGEDQDSMAVMFLYLKDPHFDRSRAEGPAVASK
jgi:cyclophilin family peptidyl-prolyl cis-trans isomerase